MSLHMVPLLNVADVERSLAFYRHLGFAVANSFEHEAALVWVMLKADGVELMLNQQDKVSDAERRARPRYGDVVLYLYVPSAHEANVRLADEGLEVTPVERQDYGLDEFYVRDPDGYELAIASHVSNA